MCIAVEPGPSTDFPVEAEVSADRLPVFDDADARAYSTGQLRKGAHITVRDAVGDGWLTIDPPAGSFDWIEQSALETHDGNLQARVESTRAIVRSGADGAKMPGPPVLELKRGCAVDLLNRPPLVFKFEKATRLWHPISPPPGRVKYVRAEGVRLPGTAAPTRPEMLVAFAPDDPTTDARSELAQIEALHRSILRNPLEQWRLENVKQRYEALLKRVTDTEIGNLIRDRLATVARQTEMSQDARTIATILARSRRRDRELALVWRRLEAGTSDDANPYDAVGLVQPSAHRVEGQKVYALIGDDGHAVAYLRIPPGVDTRGMLTRQVGVRGEARFDEHLHARVIAVRDLEPLKEDR